jgi:hypothetical protein
MLRPMTGGKQIRDYRFPGIDMPIASLARRLTELAEKHGWEVETWDEDGLGPAAGVLLKLASGRVILLLELQHAIEYFRQRGPTVHIDESELAKFGVKALLEEVLSSLNLSREDVDWTAPPINQNIAWANMKQRTSVHAPYPGTANSYFHAVWFNAEADEPVDWYDELDAKRYPLRCVRRYRDGRLEAFSYASDNWRDVMPEGPIPPVAEINSNPEFSAKEISKTEFETMWTEANRPATTSRD